MALYAFDGTGDRWNPGTRWNLSSLRELDQNSRKQLLETITPNAAADNRRFLTNVVFFYKEYVKAGGHAEYFPGVGSGAWFEDQTGKTLDFIFGGAFGIGAIGIANQAFHRLSKNFKVGDYDIDIVGYSRGAAVARIFADKIYKQYHKLKSIDGYQLKAPPTIRFIGLFDTVASFGNPLNENEIFFQPILPRTVEHAVHAMSLDLNRIGHGLDRVYGKNVLEVWFRGGHGDIGGNSIVRKQPNRDRSNITLTFMLKKFKSVLAKEKSIGNGELNLGEFNYPIDIRSPIVIRSVLLDIPGKDQTRINRQLDVFHYSIFDEAGIEVRPEGFLDEELNKDTMLERSRLVIEEPWNESEWSEQRLLQLTPELVNKFPNNQLIYQLLNDFKL